MSTAGGAEKDYNSNGTLTTEWFGSPRTRSQYTAGMGMKARRAGPNRIKRKLYERELAGLQTELVKLQEWIKARGLKVAVIFEGRDAAGKGGVIKRITESLNPRVCRVVALPKPTDREQTQWYFQRYAAHLPGRGTPMTTVTFATSRHDRCDVLSRLSRLSWASPPGVYADRPVGFGAVRPHRARYSEAVVADALGAVAVVELP